MEFLQGRASQMEREAIPLGWESELIDKQKAEQALRESEERFRDLYEEAPHAYMQVGADGVIRRANRSAGMLLGYTVNELAGRAVFELGADTPSGKPRLKQVFLKFLAGTEIRGEEIEYRRADGRSVWISLSVRPILDAEGHVVESRSILVDVTERGRAEEALRASEERLGGILASAMDAIVTVDQDRRVTLFNQAAEKVFRCTAAQIVGHPVDRLLSGPLRHLLDEARAAFGRSANARHYQWVPPGLPARRADGEEFPIEATISQVEVANEKLLTLILRDINERKRAELELQKLRLENIHLQEVIRCETGFEEIIGASPALRKVFREVQLVALTDATVLITGETGTGKELITRAIHSLSRRKQHVLIKVNCAALPSGLIESELFGHEKGAFTGALARKLGRFELADRGTIFLDEIGDLPLDLQAKLLRALQEGEFERVGGAQTLRVNVRVVAATNRDLEKAMQEGKFRPDLYYRLNVFPVHLPSLRERRADIPLLADYFVAKYSKKLGKPIHSIPPAAMDALAEYSWPGNVRELENVIERAIILTRGSELDLGNWFPSPRSSGHQLPTLEEHERTHIVRALDLTGWRVSGKNGAAVLLGLKPTTLEARMKKLGIQRK